MKNLTKIAQKIVLFLIFSLVFSCASNSNLIPEWAEHPEKEYPSQVYFSAVGSGENRAAAESSAKFALCQILGERISGEQTIFEQDDSNGNTSASLDLSVTERVIFEKIVGVTIKKNAVVSENGKNVYYALALLSKAEASLYYSQQISSLDSEISSLMAQAKANTGLLRSVSMMNKALSLAEENEYNREILSSVQGMRPSVSYKSVEAVRSERAKICAAVKVFVNVSGTDDPVVRSAFENALSEAGLTVSQTGDFEYMLAAEVALEEIGQNGKYEYVRYTVSSVFYSGDQKTVVLPYSLTGREGHLSKEQAKTRAMQKISEKIKEEFSKKLKTAMEN